MKPLWKQRNFMLLWGGQFVSYIGTQTSSIALPLIVLALTGSPVQAGIIAAIRGFIYVLLAIPAGALIDRWDRKIVMLIGNLGSGLSMSSIALALFFHILTIPQLYIMTAVEGSFFVFANLARFTSFIKVVKKEQFAQASAQWSIADNTALLVGPPLGGLLYQSLGAFVAFFIDSLSYFLNALSIFFINTPLRVETQVERKALHHEIKEGIIWLLQHPVYRFLNYIFAGRTIIESGLYLLIVVIAKQYHASSFTIGAIFAVGAIGGILGSLISVEIHKRFKFRQLLIWTSLLNFIIFSCYAFAGNNVLLAIVTGLFYFISPFFAITVTTYSAGAVPDEIKGRISSLTRLVELGAYSLGFFITGILLEYIGSEITIIVFSILLFILFLAPTLNRKLEEI